MSKATISLILGLFFWVPYIGILMSGLAIIFGIDYRSKEDSNDAQKTLALVGIILGILGILGFSPFLSFINMQPLFFSSWADMGLLDIIIPIQMITLMLFFIIYVLLDFSDLEDFAKAIISLIGAYIISIVISILHVNGSFSMDWDIVNIANAILPSIIVLGLMSIFVFLPTVLLSKNRLTFYLFILIPNIIAAIFYSSCLIMMIITLPMMILLFNHRQILKDVWQVLYKIIPIIGVILLSLPILETLTAATFLNDSGPVQMLTMFVYPILDLHIAAIVLSVFGMVLWIIIFVKSFSNKHLEFII